MPSPIQALKAFEDSPDLLRLESLLKRFNLFEAIGVIRQELRHSDLLACLLDPRQSHGLGAVFLREFLRVVQQTAEDGTALASLDLRALNLDRCHVEREWHHIDILVVDDVNRLAIIIENKIDTKESQGQLQRYLDDVRCHASYHGYQIIALYLTPEGNEPSIDSYCSASYTQVCEAIGRVVVNSRAQMSGDIVLLMEHYSQMLRRHIVSDSDVAVLCGNIYREHKQALDTIFEHVHGQEKQIWEYVRLLIQQTEIVHLGVSRKSFMVFGLKEWNQAGLFASPPHVYFEFQQFATGLTIYLTLSPGDREYRARVLEVAQSAQFPGCHSALSPSYHRLAVIPILSAADYEKPQDEIEAIISKKWAAFLGEDLPLVMQTVREEKWLWETLPLPSPIDLRTRIGQYVQSLITDDELFKLYSFARGWISFTLRDWDNSLKVRQPITNSAIFPYLAFSNRRDRLTAGMWIGPGPQSDREKVRLLAEIHRVKGVVRSLNLQEWSAVSSFEILNPGDYHKSWDEIEPLILGKWKEFVDTEVPKMIQAVRGEKWLWEEPSTE